MFGFGKKQRAYSESEENVREVYRALTQFADINPNSLSDSLTRELHFAVTNKCSEFKAGYNKYDYACVYLTYLMVTAGGSKNHRDAAESCRQGLMKYFAAHIDDMNDGINDFISSTLD